MNSEKSKKEIQEDGRIQVDRSTGSQGMPQKGREEVTSDLSKEEMDITTEEMKRTEILTNSNL